MFVHLLQTQLLIGCLLLSNATWAVAQESAAAENFAKVYAEWKDLDQQINAVVTEFGKANDERKQELRNEFGKLQVKAKAMRPRLRTAALQAYMGSPNKSQDVANILIGMAASEIYQDDISSAAVITKLMLKHQSPEKKLDDLAGVVAFVQHDFETAKKHFLRAKENDSLGSQNKFYLTKIDNYPKLWAAEKAKRSAEAKANDLPRVKFATTKGDIVFELFENEAPNTVGNFVHLVENKFYDGLTFHRVLGGFMAQGGCPEGTGRGGPGYQVPCEVDGDHIRAHFTGALSMAHAGRDTGGSQFFVTFRPTPHLDGKHTVFGRIIEGFDVLAKLQRVDPQKPVKGLTPDKINKATVIRKRNHEYKPKKVE